MNTYMNEQMVIGCLMMYPDQYGDKVNSISEDLFADEGHKEIFSAVRKVYGKTKQIDTTLVITECGNELKTEIIACADMVFSTTPFDEHLKLLYESAEKRFLREQLDEAMLEDKLTPQLLRSIADISDEAYTFNEAKRDVYADYLKNINRPKASVKTYLQKLDEKVGGLKKGTLTIIGARPSAGKTTLALNMAVNMALNGRKVVLFTLEMTTSMIVDKMLSAQCRIPYTSFNGILNKADTDAIKGFLGNEAIKENLAICDSVNAIEGICSRIVQLKPDCVFIDYAQIVRTLKRYSGDNRRLQMDYITSELKSLAKRTGCCIVLLSQLRRTESVNEPTMADLKESGGLEQDGDYIMLLHRPYSQCKSKDYKPEDASLIVEKNKFGECGRILLDFNGRFQTFYEKPAV